MNLYTVFSISAQFSNRLKRKIPLLSPTFCSLCHGKYTPNNKFSTSSLQSQNVVDLSWDNPKLNTYLKKLRENYENLAFSNPRRAQQLSSLVDILEKTESEIQDIRQTEELLKDKTTDKELKDLAAEELQAAKATINTTVNDLLSKVIEHQSKVPSAGREISIEVSAGVGGSEAMLFCQEVWNMYELCAQQRGWQFIPQEYSESELGGLRSGVVVINPGSSEDAYAALCYEAGIHRVQRVPKTERTGRMHTSTVAVVVMLQPTELDLEILPKDLKVDTYRSKGAGGQSVNTADSAVRITHLPTGTAVECQKERTQHRNKKLAMAKLRSILYQRELDKDLDASSATRKLQVGTRGRSEKIRTYNFQQDRVTDHRIGVNIHNVKGVLEGGEVFAQLLEKLKQFALKENLVHILDTNPLGD